MPNLYKVQDHGKDLLGRSMASHMMPWLRNIFFSIAHNYNLTPEFATYFCPSHFAAQEASVAPRVFATRQVVQIDGFAYGLSPFSKARGARTIMPQFFRPLNTEEERTLLPKGEETTMPQATRASNSRVPGVHVHQENTQFFH
jgi:hypothetical protein